MGTRRGCGNGQERNGYCVGAVHVPRDLRRFRADCRAAADRRRRADVGGVGHDYLRQPAFHGVQFSLPRVLRAPAAAPAARTEFSDGRYEFRAVRSQVRRARGGREARAIFSGQRVVDVCRVAAFDHHRHRCGTRNSGVVGTWIRGHNGTARADLHAVANAIDLGACGHCSVRSRGSVRAPVETQYRRGDCGGRGVRGPYRLRARVAQGEFVVSALDIFLTTVGMAAITFLSRASFLLPKNEVPMPRWLREGMRYAPTAALAAVVAPELVMTQGHLIDTFKDARIFGALAGLAFYAWRRSLFGTIVVGTGVMLALRFAAGW
ncbi:MAG: AzlD domain-containing protein [Ramlibacter sp.]|nr:AzlD domain-containing protein [Ramlibacter sp.]